MAEKKKTKIEELCENVLEATKRILPNKKPEQVVGVEKAQTGWKVLVEVLERKAVPDSQDTIGVYEMIVDSTGDILSYKRIKIRYRTMPYSTETED